MLITSTLLVIVFLIEIDRVHGSCVSYDQKSSIGVEQDYWDDYGENTCCETVYPTLYHYIKCINETLTTYKLLEFNSAKQNYRYIKFESSTIPLVPVGILPDFPSISQLFLNKSAVEIIQPGAFTYLTKLEDLYLQENNIRNISRGSLNSLRNLKLLNLSYNRLDIIEEQAFLGLFNLKTIALHHNNLITVERIFHNSNNLQNIDVSYNHLLEIPAKLLLNLTNLDELNLSYNNLTNFDFFFLPSSLKKIDLTGNQINSLENWSDLSKLQEINLSSNRLEQIETVSANLRYLNLSGNRIVEINLPVVNTIPKLITFDLSRNRISNLTHDAFAGFSNLNNLYLQNNFLANLPVGSFRDLNVLHLLNLSTNQIVEFEFGTFSGLAFLHTLDVSCNKLNYLYENSLHTLKNLEHLYIHNNFISSFDPDDLVQHISHIKYISIDNNPWNCNSLLSIVKYLEKAKVLVSGGSTQKSENIQGIPCFNSYYNKSVWFINSTVIGNDTVIRLFQNISQELKEFKNSVNKNYSSNQFNVLEDFFNNGFKNSTFYIFFNQKASSLKETGFYKVTDNNEDALSKILELRNGTINYNNLIIALVVILLMILILLIFSNIKMYLNNKICKNETKSNDILELI